MAQIEPRKHSAEVSSYIRNCFSVVSGDVTRNDGFTGTYVQGYRRFAMPLDFGRNYFIYSHHISWFLATGEWPEYELDHLDWNKQNNSFDNLREVQGKNRKEQYEGWKGLKGKGYTYHKTNKHYSCYIGRRNYIGTAKTESEATRKVAIARINRFGDWEEPFVDTKSFPLYTQRRSIKRPKRG